ncbi:hypothetical protein HAP48_0023000 [Bradyrhizobium septentrionale]|uniref:Uncharacterized protein n=1 Tax=Bradyrhizobium septentrionale TaxID=1404411 RepID=A0A973ZZU6_9BRAD|nr:hypothetical protein [Bradyrhizobium septentrionale]UGY20083.1 hypothetical protein HAP48_0023000 [Bradyrhizobium septentrionale]UGY28934.1 hypothetical protein HU675_0020390 [Bradyrhizobium septentrionale]
MNKTLVISGERLRNLLPTFAKWPRRDASPWLAHSRKIFASLLDIRKYSNRR